MAPTCRATPAAVPIMCDKGHEFLSPRTPPWKPTIAEKWFRRRISSRRPKLGPWSAARLSSLQIPFLAPLLYALHVMTNHVHGVVEAPTPPSRVFNDWKAYASRTLRAAGEDPLHGIYWTHEGSAREVLTSEDLTHAMRYVLKGQGPQMETYCCDPRSMTPA